LDCASAPAISSTLELAVQSNLRAFILCTSLSTR
jgi:hypothetical protein